MVDRLQRPFRVEETPGASFVVYDAGGVPLAYVYYEADEERRAQAITPKLSRDLARRVAAQIAKLGAAHARPEG